MDIELDLGGSVAIVTGAAGQIGSVITDAFLSAGCFVGAFDIDINKSKKSHERLHWIQVDTTNESDVKRAWEEVTNKFQGVVPTVCVAAAALDLSYIKHYRSITRMPVEQFRNTIEIVRWSRTSRARIIPS